MQPDLVELLTKAVQRLTIQLTDTDNRIKGRHEPVIQYGDRQNRGYQQRGNNPAMSYRNDQNDRCFNCGEVGHIKRDCQAEARSYAQPSQAWNNRKQGNQGNQGSQGNPNRNQQSQVNMVEAPRQMPDWYFDEQGELTEEEFDQDPFGPGWMEEPNQLYPVMTRERPRSPKPYNKDKIIKKKKASPTDPMVEGEGIITAPIPSSESVKETNLKRTRNYRKDAWNMIKEITVPIQLQDFLQYSPTAKNQVRTGIVKIKPEYVIEENHINKLELNPSQKPQTSSAYIQVVLNGQNFSAIADTGAAKTVVSHDITIMLKWLINSTKHRSVTIANGKETLTLGVVKEVPFTIAGCTICVDTLVIDTHTYDIILGNDWLLKAKARIDISAQKLQIEQYGQKYVVPISFNRGIVSRFRAEDPEEEIPPVDEEEEEMESSESDQDPQSSSEEEDDNIYYLHLPDDMNPQIETLSLQELRQMSFRHSPNFVCTKKQAELQETWKSKIPDYLDTSDDQVLYWFYRSVKPAKKQEWNFERSPNVTLFCGYTNCIAES